MKCLETDSDKCLIKKCPSIMSRKNGINQTL